MTDYTEIHNEVKRLGQSMIESAAENLASVLKDEEIGKELVLAQLLMEFLDDDIEALTANTRKALIDMAGWMGPDYAQALYRAAVFITKNT